MRKLQVLATFGLLAAFVMAGCITSNESDTPKPSGSDTIQVRDTIKVLDTTRVRDTIRVKDTTHVLDTTRIIDTIHVIDTTHTRDTIHVIDAFVVRKLSGGYDTLAGVAHLHWSAPTSVRAKAYHLYRARHGDASLTQNLVATLRDTFFVDTIYRPGANAWLNLIEPGSITVPNTAPPAQWPDYRYTYAVRAVDSLEQVGPVQDSVPIATAAPTFIKTLYDFAVNGYLDGYNNEARPGAQLTFIFNYYNEGRINRRIRWFQQDTSQLLREKIISVHSGSDSLAIRMPSAEGELLCFVLIEDEAGYVYKAPIRMKISATARVSLHGPDNSDLSPDVRVLAPLPVPRSQLAAAELGGKLYAVGGMDGPHFNENPSAGRLGLSTVEAYDPASGTWQGLAPMHHPRHDLCLAVVKGKLYAVGGWHQGMIQDTLEAYDPAADTWATLAPKAPAGLQPDVYPLGNIGDTLYALIQDNLNRAHTCAFIAGTDSAWRDLHANFPRSWYSYESNYRYATLGNTIHMGGMFGVEASHYVFNGGAKTWTLGPDIPVNATFFPVAAFGGKIYLALGMTTSSIVQGPYSNGFQIFDSATSAWTAAPGFKGRTGAAMVASGSQLYLIGGSVAGKAVATLEALPPGP